MTYVPIFRATVREAKVRMEDPSRWRGYLSRYEGRRVQVTVRPDRDARSLKANAYLWGVVYAALADWSGHEPEEIHDAMRAMFLPTRELGLPDGRTAAALTSTAGLDSEAFGSYVEKVKRFGAEQGLHIPDPNEVA